MALGAVVAAALTDHSAHPRSLTIAGLDVIKQPGGGYGVPSETIELVERGRNGVSELRFTIEDPAKVIGLVGGDEVIFWDHDLDVPIFRGFVARWQVRPALGDVARAIDVTCDGIEILLDWVTLAGAPVVPAGQMLRPMLLMLWAQSEIDTGSVIAADASDPTFWGVPFAGVGGYTNTMYATADVNGRTYRDAVGVVERLSTTSYLSADRVACTIDYYGYLRVWPVNSHDNGEYDNPYGVGTGTGTDYYADFYVVESAPVGVQVIAEDLTFGVDPSQIVRAVYVTGANAAGTGWVTDGSGIPGRTAQISEPSSDTADRLRELGRAYLSEFGTQYRGSFHYTTDTTTDARVRRAHAGTRLKITNAELGLAADFWYELGEMVTRFSRTGVETKEVTFGGMRASGAAALRRLTRGVLS